MIKNKKIFAEITEYRGFKKYEVYYKVKFTTEYDVTFLGKIIKHKSKTEEVPLLFNDKSVAEDYCSVHPSIIRDIFVNDTNTRSVKYITYRILQNGKIIGYVKWDDDFVIMNENKLGITFGPEILMVDMFVKDVIVDTWVRTQNINYVKYDTIKNYLSDLITYEYDPQKNIINHWKYQLVEE